MISHNKNTEMPGNLLGYVMRRGKLEYRVMTGMTRGKQWEMILCGLTERLDVNPVADALKQQEIGKLKVIITEAREHET